MDGEPALSLEQLAAVMALMEAGLPRDQALSRNGLDELVFREGQEVWLSRMAQHAQRQSFALHQSYTDLLAAHRLAARQAVRSKAKQLDGALPVAPVARMSPIAAPREAAATSFSAPRAAAHEPLFGAPADEEMTQLTEQPARQPPGSAPAFWQTISGPGHAAVASSRAPEVGSALPFQAPASAPAPAQAALSLEQLAWLHVQLELTPQAAIAARGTLGLDEHAQAREESVWRGRFQQDERLYGHYGELVQYYRRVLR